MKILDRNTKNTNSTSFLRLAIAGLWILLFVSLVFFAKIIMIFI